MKTTLKLFEARLLCAVALGTGSFFSLAPQCGTAGSADPTPAKTSIPWSQIGAKAGADYQGDGLAVSPTADGARLRCVFQRLEGEATREGLWLTSTVTNGVNNRFRIVAAEVTRLTCGPRIHSESPHVGCYKVQALANTGTVAIDGQTVRFTRPGLEEEYSVSMDGVRQDFIIQHRPLNPQLSTLNQRPGELAVRLAVSGARVEPVVGGAQLVLPNSGRKIAYGRLRVTDATGKELTARIEVHPVGDEVTSLESGTGSQAGLVVVVDDAEAMYPVRIDPTFSDANWISMNPSIPGTDGLVNAAVADGSGNLYIGGSFTIVGDVIAKNIAKWNGSTCSALGSGMRCGVNALAVSGSDLYAGGYFTTAGGKVSAYLARAIVNPPVLAIEGDGDGGHFIRFSGVPGLAYRLERAPGLNGPWTASSPQTAPASGQIKFWDLFPPPGQGFYRTVQP